MSSARRRQRGSSAESEGKRPETLWGALLAAVWSLPKALRAFVLVVLGLGVGSVAVWTTLPDTAKDRLVRRVEWHLGVRDSTSQTSGVESPSIETVGATAPHAPRVPATVEEPDAPESGSTGSPSTPKLDTETTSGRAERLRSAPAADDVLAIMAKVQDFVGGIQNIETITTLRQISTLTISTPDGAIQATSETLMRLPDASRNVVTAPQGTVATIVSPGVAFVITPMGIQDLPATQVKAARDDLELSILVVLRNVDRTGYTFKSAGIARLDDMNVSLVEVSAPGGGSATWFVDPVTGRLLRTARHSDRGEQVVEYREWKGVGNLRLPFQYVITLNGKQSGTAAVKAVYLNPAIGKAEFSKPAE